MQKQFHTSRLLWVFLVIILTTLEVEGKPTIDSIALLDPADMICTSETIELCQQCAKNTKSNVVYPWCCADHEGVREWCKHYLQFGLP